ncbi:Mannose-6-phosphate isomerase [Mycolicibacterium rhodesiae JS60]|nr:Mannose-6-phosphate isomerase [Mycolicibacterium rhodesiae JS60]
MPANASHRAECEIVGRWLIDSAVPFWIERGIDCHGFAYEELGFDGKPKELGYRRSLVQFRQVYVLARVAIMGFGSPDLPCALFHRAAAAAWHVDGGFVHKLDPNGLPNDVARESYDQAFGLLACAWAYAVDREPKTLEYAYRTLRFLDGHMASPHGGYLEEASGRLPRRQNPHMHLLEAFLALYEVTGDEIFRLRAAMIVGLLERRFATSKGALREYFDDTWSPAEGALGEIVEPGHHYEWVWLLHEYARLTNESIHPLASQLFDFATVHGLDVHGWPVEQVDTQGVLLRGSVKLWAITEQLKAHVARAETSARDFDPAVAAAVRDLHEHFLLREPPLWFEELAEDGTPSRRRMPASTLYHIVLAGTELLRWQSGAKSPLARTLPA